MDEEARPRRQDAKQLEEMHKKEYRDRVRTLLREHIETMAELGVVFHHVFVKEKLGFQILIARYGAEGREYIHVEETMPHSEVYPGPLKPTDELIAVNGKVIMEPTEARFKDLQKAILRCPRPLKLTFIHVLCGVRPSTRLRDAADREHAFAATASHLVTSRRWRPWPSRRSGDTQHTLVASRR